MAKLRRQKILVRHFKDPQVKDYLRITIGQPREARALVAAAAHILSER
jgi:histidinol-phosphate aminotransferase